MFNFGPMSKDHIEPSYMSVTSQLVALALARQDSDNCHDDDILPQWSAALVWEVRTEKALLSSSEAPPILSQDVNVHGTGSAVIVDKRMQVPLMDVFEAEQSSNRVHTSIQIPITVEEMALSACGAFLALTDSVGTLSLYNSNGKLLLRHHLGLDDLDTVVSITLMPLQSKSDTHEVVAVTKQGSLLQLGGFRLAERAQMVLAKPMDAVKETRDPIWCNQTSVGRLAESAQSCMRVDAYPLIKVHHFQSEDYVILGNHGAVVSVWKTRDREKNVEKVAGTDFTSAFVDAMDFDAKYDSLVILCKGSLSWWNWRDMTKLFEADVSRIGGFAVLEGFRENRCNDVSQLVVTRFYENGNPMPSFELIEIVHPKSGVSGLSVVSKTKPLGCLETRAARVDVALFASTSLGQTSHRQVLAACRIDGGVSMFMLTEDGQISPRTTDESGVSENKDVEYDRVAVTIAEDLVRTPISSLSKEQAFKHFQANLYVCTSSIGKNDEESQTILNYLLAVAARIREHTSSSPWSSSLFASLLRWCDEISELSYNWTTFQLLCTSTTEARELTRREMWEQFQPVAISDMLLQAIKAGSMRAVRILWDRHVDDDIMRNIGMLLNNLPASLSLSAYALWIQNGVLPSLVTFARQAQPCQANDNNVETESQALLAEVARWLLERAETAAAQSDVDSAIGICNLLKNADGGDGISASAFFGGYYMTPLSAGSDEIAHDAEASLDRNPLKRLERLYEKLRHVQRLAVEHHFVISFSLFEDETPATIAMSMLDRGFDALSLKREVKEQVQKYLAFYHVNVDPVLYDYVTELSESIGSCDSVDESRALVLLDEISDANLRVDAVLVMLRCAVPPYSDALKNYVTKCTRWETKRAKEIEERVQLMEIQDMLTKYNIKHYDPTDAKSASRYVSHILTQISMATAFKDAMLLIDANSGLRCDRAVVCFTERLISDCEARTSDPSSEVAGRVAKAMEALVEVKRRRNPSSSLVLFASLMEEIVEFGVMLLELKAKELDEDYDKSARKPQSFVLWMLKSLVAAYVPELKSLLKLAPDNSISSYVESPYYLLSDALLTDLLKIYQIEAEFGLLLSISNLRDPEMCKKKLKGLMNPDVLFAEDLGVFERARVYAVQATCFVKGKGKKRASQLWHKADEKRQRTNQQYCERQGLQCTNPGLRTNPGLQQDDKKTRLIFDLNRFASAVGIDAKTCQSFIVQSAVEYGSIFHAVHYSRGLCTKRWCNGISHSNLLKEPVQTEFSSKANLAGTLRRLALSFLTYSSSHVKEIYDEPLYHNQPPSPAQLAQVQAPMYALELLKYALCTCDKDGLDETLLRYKETSLINDALQLTQHNFSIIETEEVRWTLYPRWFRGDACALASYETMKLVTKFATERTKLGRESQDNDLIASKRYVSFLVEQRAGLLSLQALMSMQELPEEGAVVANLQMIKLLSSVFQSQEIDNHLALGLMLSMKQEDAYHAFRKQISRENVAKDFKRFQHLALIGADAARAWQQIAFLHQCVELEGNARWWHYLTLLGIECDHKAFHSARRDLPYIRRLVPQLITRSNYDFYTVLEFTRHYQMDDSFPALKYAEALLGNESATYNLEYQDKIVRVMPEIHEQHLVKMLLKSIRNLSGHDYDRLLFAFRLLSETTTYRDRTEVERRVEVLRCLKAFAASQSQIDPLLNGHVARVSTNVRNTVSFHELMAKPREVLSRLVNKENFNALIGLTEPLGLEQDELQMLLFKNMISLNLHIKTTVDGDTRTELFAFSAFEDILLGLSDTESRVTAAEWLAENFPVGDEKLNALEFASKAAGSGLNEAEAEDQTNTSFTGQEALARLETKILRVKVEMLLQNAKSQPSSGVEAINDKEQMDQLLALVSEPEKLLNELYRRYALVFYNQRSDALDVVASSIGDLLLLPIAKIRLDLVREWLVKDALFFDNELTSLENPFKLLKTEKLHKIDDDFSKKILYIASSSDKAGHPFGEQVFSYLVEFVKDSQPRAGVTFRAKGRALRVILCLGQLHRAAVVHFVDTMPGIESTDLFFRELIESRKHYNHMVTFEEHRVPYDMAYLLKSDKEVLVRSFLRRFSRTEPWVLQCASQLMLDYRVGALDLWEDVLSNMLQLGMVRSLAALLGPLGSKSFVRSLKCGQQAWEQVLTSPIGVLDEMLQYQSKIGLETSDGAELSANESRSHGGGLCLAGVSILGVCSAMKQMVRLLQRCPFLDQMDVPAIVVRVQELAAMTKDKPNLAEVARQLNLHGFAVQCALVIPKPVARFEALVEIIRAGGYSSVLHELLNTSCVLDGEPSKYTLDNDIGDLADDHRLIEECFAEAAKRKDYACILHTRLEPRFIEYLAASANIDDLVSLLLADERTEVALQAVELYYKFHPTAAPPMEGVTSDGNENASASSTNCWKVLDAYLSRSLSDHLERFEAS